MMRRRFVRLVARLLRVPPLEVTWMLADPGIRDSMEAISKAAGAVGAQQREVTLDASRAVATGAATQIRALEKSIEELHAAMTPTETATLEINKGGRLIVDYVNRTNRWRSSTRTRREPRWVARMRKYLNGVVA